MPSLADVEVIQSALVDLSSLAIGDLVRLWRAIEDRDQSEIAQLLAEAFPELAAPYQEAAALMSAQWYDELDADSDYQAVVAPPRPPAGLAASSAWAMTQSNALGALSGALQRSVFNASRDTIIENVTREGVRWARHASANACQFCKMLATRGDVYKTESTAMKSHDNCHCIAVPVRSNDTFEPAPYVADWEKQYVAARRESGSGDPKAILAAWRQLDKASA